MFTHNATTKMVLFFWPSTMLWLIVITLLIGTTSAVHQGCYDKSTACTKSICTQFSEYTREKCARTCGFCNVTVPDGDLSIHGSCVDQNLDCNSKICRDYPYTARYRCAKTCNYCDSNAPAHYSASSSSSVSTSGIASSSRHTSGSIRTSDHSGTTGSHVAQPYSTLSKGGDSTTHGLCVDKDPDCNSKICRDYPYTAKYRCTKTCNYCGSDISTSSSSSVSTSGLVSSSRYASGSIRTSDYSGTTGSHVTQPYSTPSRDGDSTTHGLCVDKDPDCNSKICRDYPYTAKYRCAKTCNYCGSDAPGHYSTSSSSSVSTSGIASSSRHTSGSIRTNDHSGTTGSHVTPPYSTLSKSKEVECIDLNTDCTQMTCRDYPFTAKERCAKTCGFCRKELIGTSLNRGTTSGAGERYSSPSSFDFHHSGASTQQGTDSTRSVGECKDDKNAQCSSKSCLEHPSIVRTKCPETCGFCDGSSHGSLIELRSPSVEATDDSTVITLDSDDTASKTTGIRPTTIVPSHSMGTSANIGTSFQDSRRSSTSGTRSYTSSVRGSTHTQFTTQEPLTVRKRYPGRTGPCADDNRFCTKRDCHIYPKFNQKYCEKTCNYC